MEIIDRTKLIAAMRAAYPMPTDAAIERRADELIETIDERLIPNVIEWIEGRELSDIRIGQYCIGMIMQIRDDKDFIGAVEALSLFARDEKAGTFAIWRARA